MTEQELSEIEQRANAAQPFRHPEEARRLRMDVVTLVAEVRHLQSHLAAGDIALNQKITVLESQLATAKEALGFYATRAKTIDPTMGDNNKLLHYHWLSMESKAREALEKINDNETKA